MCGLRIFRSKGSLKLYRFDELLEVFCLLLGQVIWPFQLDKPVSISATDDGSQNGFFRANQLNVIRRETLTDQIFVRAGKFLFRPIG